MVESGLNTLINNNLQKLGFSHKIGDFVGGVGIQNPFDGFSVFWDKNWYWETKLIKNEYNAFNFRTIEDHQLENLLQIKKETPDAVCIIFLGYFIPYKFLHLFMFDINLIKKMIDKGKKSFLKKEILEFKENNMYFEIKKKEFKEFNMKKIIY